jgi:hypothetical protein
MIAVVAIAMMLMISAASASADTVTYAGASLTTGDDAWMGSGIVYPGHFDLAQSDLTLIVHDVDMSASADGTWVSNNLWNPGPTHHTGIQMGITNKTAIGPVINPRNSAFQSLAMTVWGDPSHAYYLGGQMYTDSVDQYGGPCMGWNTPFQGGGTPNGGTHGTGSVANDTFDLKIVYHDLGVGNGFRVTAYESVQATTDPYANIAGTWYPMYDSPGYQDVPELAVAKTNVQPFVFVGNWEQTGAGTITWGNVEATGALVPEPGTLVLLVTAGLGALAFAWRRRRS